MRGLDAGEKSARLVVHRGTDDQQLVVRALQSLQGRHNAREALVHSGCAGEQDNLIRRSETKFRTERITRVGRRVKIVIIADMRQYHAAEFLPQFLIGDCDLIEHLYK